MNNKNLAIVLILTMAISSLSLIMVKPANAQLIPIPAFPQFEVRFVNVSSTPNYLIEISIENQPFDYSNNGSLYQEYFNVRVKQHFAENWTEVYPIVNGTSLFNGKGPTPGRTGNFSYAEYISADSPMQSNSGVRANFYVIPVEFYLENNSGFEGYSIQKTYGVWGANPIGNRTFLDEIPIDAQLDFQVQALVGHNSTIWFNISALFDGVGTYVPAAAYDTEGNWSNTQTITIGETSANTSPNPTPSSTPNSTPTVPEFPTWTIPLLLTMMVASACLLVYHKKHKQPETNKLEINKKPEITRFGSVSRFS